MWKKILKNNSGGKTHIPYHTKVEFMNGLYRELVDTIERKEGLEGFEFSNGMIYFPNYILSFNPNVGRHNDDFISKPFEEIQITLDVDWYDLWYRGFEDEINEIADNFGEEYRLKAEDQGVYPVYEYNAGSHNKENGTISVFSKTSNLFIESLIKNIHKKIESRFDGRD